MFIKSHFPGWTLHFFSSGAELFAEKSSTIVDLCTSWTLSLLRVARSCSPLVIFFQMSSPASPNGAMRRSRSGPESARLYFSNFLGPMLKLVPKYYRSNSSSMIACACCAARVRLLMWVAAPLRACVCDENVRISSDNFSFSTSVCCLIWQCSFCRKCRMSIFDKDSFTNFLFF